MKIKKTVITLVIWLLLQIVSGIPYTIKNSIQLLIIGLLASQIVEILVFLALKYFKPKEIVSPRPSWNILLLSIPLGFSVLYAIDLLAGLVGAPDLLSDIMGDLCGSSLGILSIAVVGPIAEEIMMRRIILTEMKEATNSQWGGILLSAAIFAVIHLNPAQVIFAFPAGVLLGWLYCRTGSLLVPICIHILNNSCVVIATRMGMTEQPEGTAMWILLAVCVAVAAILFFCLNRQYKEKSDAKGLS